LTICTFTPASKLFTMTYFCRDSTVSSQHYEASDGQSTGGDATLLESCARESLRLLERNLTPAGVLAATPGPEAEAKRYTRIFGRDAAICALGMAGCGIPRLEQGAVSSLDSLASLQAPNGQ